MAMPRFVSSAKFAERSFVLLRMGTGGRRLPRQLVAGLLGHISSPE
jgi:hypothetical protein